eukprot:SAG25_NODE_1734_length_2425_cov_3.272884_3_plen_157_part_00
MLAVGFRVAAQLSGATQRTAVAVDVAAAAAVVPAEEHPELSEAAIAVCRLRVVLPVLLLPKLRCDVLDVDCPTPLTLTEPARLRADARGAVRGHTLLANLLDLPAPTAQPGTSQCKTCAHARKRSHTLPGINVADHVAIRPGWCMALADTGHPSPG